MVGQLTRLLPPNTDEVHSGMAMGKKKDDELSNAMFVYNYLLATIYPQRDGGDGCVIP